MPTCSLQIALQTAEYDGKTRSFFRALPTAIKIRLLTAILFTGLAVVSTRGEPQTPPGPGFSASPNLSGGTTAEALNSYEQLTDIEPYKLGGLPQSSGFTVTSLPTETNAAVAVIERELAKVGIELVPRGGKFALAVPSGWTNAPLGPQLARIESGLLAKTSSPMGQMSFSGMPLIAALEIYSQLCGRTILRPAALPPVMLPLQTRTPLTSDEAAYALEATMALNGIAAVRDGDRFVQVLPLVLAAQAQTRAPQAEPGTPLIDPGKVPVFTTSSPLPLPRLSKPQTPAERLRQLYVDAYTSPCRNAPPPLTPPPDVDILIGVGQSSRSGSSRCLLRGIRLAQNRV